MYCEANRQWMKHVERTTCISEILPLRMSWSLGRAMSSGVECDAQTNHVLNDDLVTDMS